MPDLSLEALPLIITLLVPGFVWNRVHRYLQVNQRPASESWLDAFTLSAVNFAVWSWKVPALWVQTVADMRASASLTPSTTALWFTIALVSPTLLGVVTGAAHRKSWLRSHLLTRFRLNLPNPIETAWDLVFSRDATQPEVMWTSVTLHDGVVIEGYFAEESLASSNPAERDLYLEQLFKIRSDGTLGRDPASAGVWIAGGTIKTIEFKRVKIVRTG